MSPQIQVYRLSRKFVNERKDIPENAKQVIYYTLAVGHHVGVLDCFTSLVNIPENEYIKFIDSLPVGEGRLKLEGVLKWGEIEINQSHVSELSPLFEQADPEFSTWTALLKDCLVSMTHEPAFYLMVKKTA